MFASNVVNPARRELEASQEMGASQLRALSDSKQHFDVIIIGAGLSGASAAYHLTQATNGPTSVLIVDRGNAGAGSHDRFIAPDIVKAGRPAPRTTEDDTGDEKVYHPGNSGGVVFSAPHFANGPTCLKFSVQLYPSTTPNFIEHHGKGGARRYLELAALGIEIQKALAKSVCDQPDKVLEEKGSLLLAVQQDVDSLFEEYRLLQQLGVSDMEWWDRDKVEALHGEDAKFVAVIHFPKDCRVDSLAYVRALLKAADSARKCRVTVVTHCPAVIDVKVRALGR